jgi:hypothetical protein
MGPSGSPGVRNAGGKLRIGMGTDNADDGYIKVYTHDDKPGVSHFINNSGGGYSEWRNSDDKVVGHMSAAVDNKAGLLVLQDATGKKRVVELNGNNGGTILVGGKAISDLAETFDFRTREGVIPGSVVSIAPDNTGLEASSEPYHKTVVGVERAREA